MRTLAVALLCIFLLPSCVASRNKPPVVVTKREPVLPPASLMAPCVAPASDGTIGGELARLSWLTQCERDDKAALRAWRDGFTPTP